MEPANKAEFKRLIAKHKIKIKTEADKELLIEIGLVIAAAIAFGYWQHSIAAGIFIVLCWFIICRWISLLVKEFDSIL
jgi:hypothetical protein